MIKLKYLNWLLFIALFVSQSCTNKDEILKKEIVGSYSFAKTDDSEDGIFVTVNGTSVFKPNGIYESNGTMIMSIIDEYGDRSTLKYKIEMYAKYEIKNSYIIYDFKLENIGIALAQYDNRELSKIMQDHYIPQMKHEMLVNTKEKILELTDKYLKTEEDVDGEKSIMTSIRVSEKPTVGLWKNMSNNIITSTSIAGVEVIGKTFQEIDSKKNPMLEALGSECEISLDRERAPLVSFYFKDCGEIIEEAVIYDNTLSTAKGLHIGSTSGDVLKAYPNATVAIRKGSFDEHIRVDGISYLFEATFNNGQGVGKYSSKEGGEMSKIYDKNVKISAIIIGKCE
jgi:hypothetical protein